jgi:stage V sporulation protein G
MYLRGGTSEGTAMEHEDDISAPTALIGLTVFAVEPVHRSKLFALISVEVEIEGIAVIVHGIQAMRDPLNIRIEMPKFRDGNGTWRSAVTLPDEVKAPLTAAVLEALVEHGLAKRGFA